MILHCVGVYYVFISTPFNRRRHHPNPKHKPIKIRIGIIMYIDIRMAQHDTNVSAAVISDLTVARTQLFVGLRLYMLDG